MTILFIIVASILLAIVFMSGFWAGKHCERAKWKRIYFDIETVLNKHTFISMGTGPETPESLSVSPDADVRTGRPDFR